MCERDPSLSPLKSLRTADASWAGPTFMKEKIFKNVPLPSVVIGKEVQ